MDPRRCRGCAAWRHRPAPYCPEKAKTLKPARAYVTRPCPYHRRYLIDRSPGLETCSRRRRGKDTAHDRDAPCTTAGAEWKSSTPPPARASSCRATSTAPSSWWLFEAVHARADAALFRYLDGRRLAETRGEHKLSADLGAGGHLLSVEDEEGRSAAVSFQAFRRAAGGN